EGLSALGTTAAAGGFVGSATAAAAGAAEGGLAALGATAAAGLMAGASAGAGQACRLAALGPGSRTAALGALAAARTRAGAPELGALRASAGAGRLETLRAGRLTELAEFLLKLRVLVGHACVVQRIMLPLLHRGGVHDIDVIELAERHHIDLNEAERPDRLAPYGGPDPQGRPKAPHRADYPPRRIPEERDEGRRPIADAEDDDGVVDRHVDHVGLDRLDCDVFRNYDHLAGTRRRR